jgi:uncharacterized membrane protein YedE/YeeE
MAPQVTGASVADAVSDDAAEFGISSAARSRVGVLARYALAGFLFGIVLMKSEAVSWFRIQEMFRFQSIHMFGLLGTAVATAAVSIRVLRLVGVTSVEGDPISLVPKSLDGGTRYLAGGTIFGVGWALTGACPGPLFVLLGAGVGVMAVTIAAALAGTLVYGFVRPRLSR